MPVLNKGKAIYPFWGASLNLITGLDPLGLQTTSEATYAMLLRKQTVSPVLIINGEGFNFA